MTAISDSDVFETAPDGPTNGGTRSATLMRGHLGKINNRVRFIYERVVATLIGRHTTFAAGDVDTGTNRITITSHGYSTGNVLRYGNVGGTAISISGVALPLTESLYGAALYAIVIDANTLEIESSSGGGTLDITAAGSGTHYFFKVPSSGAGGLMLAAITTAAGNTIPAGLLSTVLASAFMPLGGGTMTGATTYSGINAWKSERCAALNDAATQTITGPSFDHYFCPDVSQDSVYTINDGTFEGQSFTVTRRGASNAFKADFHDSGANLLARFPASSKSWVTLKWSNQDGLGLKWHADQWGGSTTATT